MDYTQNRQKTKMFISMHDLRLEDAVDWTLEQFHNLARGGTKVKVWFAPPCGTASRAREFAAHAGAPRPLRSKEHPAGLPGLDAVDSARVATANFLYNYVLQVIQRLPAGTEWAIENPQSSYLWLLQGYPELLGEHGGMVVKDVDLTACNFGGRRPKRTKLRTNMALGALSGPCTGRHPPRFGSELHAPWGVQRDGTFATAEEAEYPGELCDRITELIFGQTTSTGHAAAVAPSLQQPAGCETPAPRRPTAAKALKHARAAGAGRQARGRGPVKAVPEHKAEMQAVVCTADARQALLAWAAAKSRRLISGWHLDGLSFPPGAQLLSLDARKLGGTGGASAQEVLAEAGLTLTVTAGVPWSEQEFFEAAKAAEHPLASGYPLRQWTAAAVTRTLAAGPEGLAEHQAVTLARWRQLAADLAPREAALHAQVPADVECVVRCKKLLLFVAILKEIKYDDVEAAQLMATGFPVLGQLGDSWAFPPRAGEARDSVRDLIERAPAAQAVAAEVRHSGDAELDQALWEATLKEVRESKVLAGPVSAQELTAKYGRRWVPCRRFALRQKDKVRPIDDFSELGHNATVQAPFTVDLGGIDEVVAIARTLARAAHDGGAFEIIDERGGIWAGTVHPAWHGAGDKVLGCCLDLVAAFRQVPRAVAHAPFTIISVLDPGAKAMRLFELKALAFGQMAAVYSFNRVARAIDAVLAHLGVVCSNYVDDYPIVGLAGAAATSVATAKAALDLLGWEVKKADELVPRPTFVALGVVIDFTAVTSRGLIVVSNKAERVEDDVSTISELLRIGRAAPSAARRLRGRLQYAGSQTFGRCGAFANRSLRDLAEGRGGSRALMPLEEAGLRWWAEFLAAARPREISVREPRRPIVILTDGAVEDTVSVGGVFIDRDTGKFEFFGAEVPQDVAAVWGRVSGSEQVIGQAELAPLVLAAKLWQNDLQGRHVLFFVDNDSAKDAVVRGYSPSLPSALLVGALWQTMAAAGAAPWFDRVPGPSNIADGPSRLRFEDLRKLGAQQRVLEEGLWETVGRGKRPPPSRGRKRHLSGGGEVGCIARLKRPLLDLPQCQK